MIPYRFINEWRQYAPWQEDAMVEQDLIISRALIEIFNDDDLASKLAFRGGTALHKLYLKSTSRYSEDIDLVQIKPETIGQTFDNIRRVIDPWLGKPKRKLKQGRANLYYRFNCENDPNRTMSMKIEINTREHYSFHNYQKIPFSINNSWHSGSSEITSFSLNELLSTKLRALYQRLKGRDLFDLYLASSHDDFNVNEIIYCFNKYLEKDKAKVTRAQFEENLYHKLNNPQFCNDIFPLLAPNQNWDISEASKKINDFILHHLPGEPWAGH